MKKYVLCKETATLKEHQRIRAERELHKRVAQWAGGDILNIVFDGEIQNRIDWMPEIFGEYGTLEDAQAAAFAQALKSTASTYGPNLYLTAYYIEARTYFEADNDYESDGMYDLPRETFEEETPDKGKNIEAFAEYLYRQGYDACDICKLREAYDLSEAEEDAVYSTLQSLYNDDQWILDKYYGKFRSF